MIPPVLRTERLLLRQWRDGDSEALQEIYSQPELLEHNPVYDAAAHVERFARQWEREGLHIGAGPAGTDTTWSGTPSTAYPASCGAR